jgi:hypothetical protein
MTSYKNTYGGFGQRPLLEVNKYTSKLKKGHDFSIDLRFHTHYEYNVLTIPTTIIINHLVLPVVSA